jgi:hypothetical protein
MTVMLMWDVETIEKERQRNRYGTVSALRAFPIFPKKHPSFLLVSILDVVRTSLLQD